MKKSSTTKVNILESGLKLVRKCGFESLSIGILAKSVGMSKSGLFAHFESKERMQVMILDYAADNFVLSVIKPALSEKRGLPRLNKMIEGWAKWSSQHRQGGCPLISASIEFDDKPGIVRDSIQNHLLILRSTLIKSIEICKEEEQLSDDVESEQITFEIFSSVLGLHLYKRLLNDEKAEERMQLAVKNILLKYQ